MKKKLFSFCLAFLLGVGLPWFLVSNVRQNVPVETTAEATEQTQPPFTLPVLTEDGVTSMELEDYILGVVLGEMPADFEMEALKAQSVVARTFTLRLHTVYQKHEGASICTDYACCQAYCSAADYIQKGGTEESLEKVRTAVFGTAGQVLTYQGELIEATYFSCSGGRTEDAVAVWGTDIPYLQATDSPGEEFAAHYTDTVTFPLDEFARLLGLPGGNEITVGDYVYTEGGGVDTVNICGSVYKGTTLRQKLSLRSTAFTMTVMGDSVIVTTRGFGHRVGMSQYGADAMALEGHDYTQILTHYYHGTVLEAFQKV